MKMHSSVTVDRVAKAAEESLFGTGSPGICVACGDDREGCEPDARNYECYSCGKRAVFGAEELLMYLA